MYGKLSLQAQGKDLSQILSIFGYLSPQVAPYISQHNLIIIHVVGIMVPLVNGLSFYVALPFSDILLHPF